MKKNVWIYGITMGMMMCIGLLYVVDLCYKNPEFEGNDVVGYAAMVVIFSLIFIGIRNYRNKELAGVISLGKAFKNGALIALVGSTMYVVVWLFYYYLYVPDFMDKYTIIVLKEASRNGASAMEIADKTKEMAEFKELYKNPLFVILITYTEVLPIGLLVAFISSLILRRKIKDPVPHSS